MNVKTIHNTLKNDIAYKHSINNLDVINMAIVLRAHGFDYSEETICGLFDQYGNMDEVIKMLDPVDQCIHLVTRPSA